MLDSFKLKLEVTTIEPVGYFDMISLISNASMVLTDSGGLQKEAYFFKKPCITMREQTEWVELIESGANVLAGSDEKLILQNAKLMLDKKIEFKSNLYGDGKAAVKIAKDLLKSFHD